MRPNQKGDDVDNVARLVHDVDPQLGLRDAHVHVGAEDEELPHEILHLVLEHLVALGFGDALILPVRERMRPR